MNILCLKKISRTPAVSRSIDIPSIPSAGKSHGYHLNDDDSIRKRTPPASDDTIGPAYYKPQFVSSKRLMRTLGRLLLLYISFMRQQLLSDNQNTDFLVAMYCRVSLPICVLPLAGRREKRKWMKAF